jgi:pyridoxal phosphate enzyme (YggS family)
MNSFLENSLAILKNRISEAAARSGRSPAEIELVVVSKGQSIENMRELVDGGTLLFGESRLQEALSKIAMLPARVRWHCIGHLQSNKVRKALPCFELIHSVDNEELACTIDRIASEIGLFPRVLLEVNVSGEGTKYGFSPEVLKLSFEKLLRLPRLQVEGLMTMAPLSLDPETARPYFRKLRELRDELAANSGVPLSTLSMGMSGDYEVAIEEGATLVRVGSAIFKKNAVL